MSSQRVTTLNLKSSIQLPQTVILPLALYRLVGGERRLVIRDHAQEVALGVAQWMRSDSRYAGWFKPFEAVRPQPAAQIATAAAEASSSDERWNKDQPMPALREYAKRHGIDLTAISKKADVVAKLREARSVYEDGEVDTP